MSIIHVVSCSTGKDSVTALLLAKERFGAHRVVGIICDTGNEHEYVWQHREYLERVTGIRIIVLTAGFAAEIAEKRKFIASDVRTRREYDTRPVFEADGKTPVWKRDGRGNIVLSKKGKPVQKTVKVGSGRRVRWTNKAKRRALAHLHPTGNPFLDLCMWKGRFPSRKAQFCTEELKRNMAVSFQIELQDQGYTVVSWQGVRRDESQNRKDAKQFEKVDENFYIYRPIVDWTAEDTFAYAAEQGVDPNPLYKCGMGRVGCMPCINASKDEIKEIAFRFPWHMERIAEWEEKVSLCSKRGFSTFFHKVDDQAGQYDSVIFSRNKVHEVIAWAKTSRGGKQFSLLDGLDEPNQCSSSYGLCE